MRPSTKREPPGLLNALPAELRWSAILFTLHVLTQPKVVPAESFGFFAGLLLVWGIAKGKAQASFHILYYPLALYGLVSTLSALAADNRLHAFGEIMLWIKMLVFPTAVILLRNVPFMRNVTLKWHIVTAMIIAVYGIAQYVIQDRRALENRITGPSSHVMTYSGLLLAASLLLVVLSAHRRKPWLYLATATVSFALLLTFTRSVWYGWLLAVFVLLTIKRPLLLPIAAGALLIFVTFMPMEFFGRLVSAFDVEQSSNLDRIRMAEAGTEMIKDYPVLGVGPGNVKEVYPLYRKPDAPRFRPPHLHNNFIQLWAERGILGVSAYLLFMVLFLRECARGWGGPAREFAEAGVAVAIGLGYAGLFEFNWGDTEVFYMTLTLFALIVTSLEAARPASNEVAQRVVPAA
jgi:O-antigen ligase